MTIVQTPDIAAVPRQPPEQFDVLMDLYCALLTKSSQEGDGIWSRFNVMIGINAGLVAAFAFVFQADKPGLALQRYSLLLVICIMGIAASLWSLYVLLRLWGWQQYWRNQLRRIEDVFPDAPGWVKSFTPEGSDRYLLRSDPGVRTSLWLGYTQPFMGIFLLAWIALTVITLFV
jgi:hypothetical protein